MGTVYACNVHEQKQMNDQGNANHKLHEPVWSFFIALHCFNLVRHGFYSIKERL